MDKIKLHTTDLPLVINRKFYNDLVENFQWIEQYYLDVNKELDSYNKRISKLEQTSATHDEVKEVSQEWNKRASHIARGTDIPTTRAVVMQILASIGQVDLSKLSDADEKIVTKDEFDAFVNKVKGKINLDN
ncbi:hypothetical protein [Limosilactobacillus reuteri]|uniref:hypothetical protein n=1 Tax=Limosilactobacillus reuteri TaxID=1598 RepID=UPI00128E8BD5|nr:hypothetical protein [Limosilactobacillus reuteri]MQB58365.1 hypothetical protein [Limosilactobacillus reuteri]MQB82470.1 hypothetical protein [Limosilactobacillus reuteri]